MMELLGVAAYGFLLYSMSQHDIIKLRLFGAVAGGCFTLQFMLSDLPTINVLGQAGLVCYGIFQALQEIKIKKNKA